MDGAVEVPAAAEEQDEQEEAPLPQWSGDSGNVSQSHSSASGIGGGDEGGEDDGDEDEGEASRGELLLAAAAADYAAYLLPSSGGGGGSGGQIETLDKSLEDLLTRVDEFVGMLDMIRNDSSQVVNESVPHIHAKAVEMRQLYRKIDKLEAFVKMVGNRVTGMEEQITKAESDLRSFPNTFKKLLHTINVPSFLNKSSFPRQSQTLYEPPDLFKTEDYFPCVGGNPYV